jgi:hypothetical protein
MRNMSFSLTKQQIYDETKDVTRRLASWRFLKPGDVVMACEQCQGLKKGQHVKKIKPITIVSTRPEPLNAITQAEVIREGFPHMTPLDFVTWFCKLNHCHPHTIVNRIEFAYADHIRQWPKDSKAR